MKGKPGTFEWWAGLVRHTARVNRAVIISPTARRTLKQVLRPAAFRAVLKRREWNAQETYPTRTNQGPRRMSEWLYSRRYGLHVSSVIKYFVPALVTRWTERRHGVGSTLVIIEKGTRTHTGCAAHMTNIERIWALYHEFPESVLAQQMLVACANALRRKGRVIPPMGRPVKLVTLAKLANLELRRVVVEMQGVTLPARALASDATGKLYRVDATQNLLEVRCPSTGRRYLLGVPVTSASVYNAAKNDWVQTVLDTPAKAQRWTLGIEADEVKVVAQT